MSKIIVDEIRIREILRRGVSEIIFEPSLEKKLLAGKKLRIKLGIDPTSPNIHLGRSIPLLKLRDFQELGHQMVFIVGDFTGVIGDTSDKESERPMLTPETIKENLQDYIAQAGKIIDIDQCEIHYNSEWLGKLTYKEIAEQANVFSVAEFTARDNLAKRLADGKRVSLREMLYPLMQGYDSVAIKADVEIGGNDQRFNLLAGRKLQEFYNQPAQDIMMGPLLLGTDGRKMSSSWGNTINLTDEPETMFGKVMSLSDDLIIKYLILTTRLPMTEILQDEAAIQNGTNPRDIKLKLAAELVRFYHGQKASAAAQEFFVKTVQNKELPDDIELKKIKAGSYKLIELLAKLDLAASKSEARRLIEQGGIKIDSVAADNFEQTIAVGDKEILMQRGKRQFLRIVGK